MTENNIKKNPAISVIIPLYNKELIVERTVKSVLAQTFTDFELIIVDDGSTDKSLSIIKSIDDNRIRIIEQKNGGPSKARNTGIKNAQTNWLYFIDADDEMFPDSLGLFWHYINAFPQYKMFCGEVTIKDRVVKRYKMGELNNAYKATMLGKLFQCSGSTIYRKDLCAKIPYNERLMRYEDLECLFNKYRDSKVFLLDFPVGKVNIEHSQASSSRKDISEDFVGHLSFKGKSFWEKMALYNLYLCERNHYREQIDAQYPILKYRYDLLFLLKLMKKFYK